MGKKQRSLSDQQLIVSTNLLGDELSGAKLRARLEEAGHRMGGAGFYAFMLRMEEAGLVKGRYVKREAGGRVVRERHYKLLGVGRRAVTAKYELFKLLEVDMEGGLGRA